MKDMVTCRAAQQGSEGAAIPVRHRAPLSSALQYGWESGRPTSPWWACRAGTAGVSWQREPAAFRDGAAELCPFGRLALLSSSRLDEVPCPCLCRGSPMLLRLSVTSSGWAGSRAASCQRPRSRTPSLQCWSRECWPGPGPWVVLGAPES